MTEVFHIPEFEIKGIRMPEFKLKKGNLIRVYTPYLDSNNIPLGFDLNIELIKVLQSKKTDLPWAKNYSQSRVMDFLRPLTVKRYLLKKMRITHNDALKIVNEIEINFNDKFEHLNFTKRKALIIKATFNKSNVILLDYLGVSADGIQFLEKLVNTEIEKGKSAIAFDRIEFAIDKEPYENITQIKIHVPNNTYK